MTGTVGGAGAGGTAMSVGGQGVSNSTTMSALSVAWLPYHKPNQK